MLDYVELRKELYEKFHDAYHKLYVSELQDEIERLRSALEPFACMCSVKGMGAGGNCTKGSGECACWNVRVVLDTTRKERNG